MLESSQKIFLFIYLIIVTFFSVLRVNELIYLEVAVVMFATIIIILNIKRYYFFSLTILCISFLGNFVAPMDNELRFDSSYPSIHTLPLLGSIKAIDFVILLLALSFAVKYFIGKIQIEVKIFFLILLSFMMSSLLYVTISDVDLVFDTGFMLFVTRGIILFFIFNNLLRSLAKSELIMLVKLVIYTCISLMIFAHLIHSGNPMQRELFGFNVTVAFAGDEYGSIGILLASILLLDSSKKKFCYFIVLVCFILAIIAGRKSAVPYFFFVSMMIYFSAGYNSSIGFIKKSLLLTEHLYITFALFFIIALDFLPLNLAFSESIGILKPTITSLSTLFNEHSGLYVFGIGPFFKYPLLGLDSVFDHPFAFGSDAGELYKIKLWFFPFDRAILNFGLIIPMLFVLYIVFLKKYSSMNFYILLYGANLFFFNAISIIMCFSLAIGFAAISLSIKDNSLESNR